MYSFTLVQGICLKIREGLACHHLGFTLSTRLFGLTPDRFRLFPIVIKRGQTDRMHHRQLTRSRVMRGGGGPVRLWKVAGYEGRTNDIIYCPPLSPSALSLPKQSVVVYFGGDVQDFPENMGGHRDNKHYIRWNLQSMATILQGSFQIHHIIIVRPSRMEFRMFSCFDNFVPSDNTGAPDHTPNHHALQHLELLLENISNLIVTQGTEECGSKREKLRLDKAELTLVGFSKGCVVLNQLVYEFHFAKTLMAEDEALSALVARIRHMYWLDGGHAGGKNTWITSRSLLETLARLGVTIQVHVTPYQVGDERRPWIRREERGFCEMLEKLGAPISRTLHMPATSPTATLLTHFELLSIFNNGSSPSPSPSQSSTK